MFTNNSILQLQSKKFNIEACSHVFGEYKGKKYCCTKCEGVDIGMGTSWELVKKLSKRKITKLRNTISRLEDNLEA